MKFLQSISKKLMIVAMCMALSFTTWSADYYVSAARGKGKKATKEKPAKDLGNIIKKLQPGDVIHVAEGTYLGRGKSGSYVITVPVSIIGGYDDTFSKRDPWGAHKTILSGDNLSTNWVRTPRIMIDLMKYKGKEMPAILVDGVIIDDAARNRYTTDGQKEIMRMADPKTGKNPSPDQGGLVVRVSKTGNYAADALWKITVQNCIVMNSGPTQGALSVSGYKNSDIVIRNNLVINNTGTGIICGTKYTNPDGAPKFLVENNTVMFTWKFDPSAQSYSGNTFKVDRNTITHLRNNVLAFADRYGVHNAVKADILLDNNLILANVAADYLEFDTKMALEDIEDEADYLNEDTEGNVKKDIAVPIDKGWLKEYGSRVLVDRNAAEADIQVEKSAANELRRILGLPVWGGTIAAPETPVWLHRLPVAEAIKAGAQKYDGQYGCQMPSGDLLSFAN